MPGTASDLLVGRTAGAPSVPPVYPIARRAERGTRAVRGRPRVTAMTRFAWAAWGLLVVVLDLPLAGWDVLPDIVGYAWIVIGLAGAAAVHPAFVRARAAAAAGIPVAVVTGTPLFVDQAGVVWGAVFAEIVLTVVPPPPARHGDPRPRSGGGDSDQRRWANGIRIGAPVAGLVRLVGLVVLGNAARGRSTRSGTSGSSSPGSSASCSCTASTARGGGDDGGCRGPPTGRGPGRGVGRARRSASAPGDDPPTLRPALRWCRRRRRRAGSWRRR